MVRTSIKYILVILVSVFQTEVSCFAGELKIQDRNLINSFFGKLYDFSFDEADSLVLVMTESGIDDATLDNIKANLAWWKLLSGEAIDSNIDSCNFYLDQTLKSNSGTHDDLNSLFNIIFAYSLKSRLENYRGNNLKSLLLFHKSLSYIEKCKDLPVKDDRLNLVLGLYYYFIDYFKDEYFMVSALFFPFHGGDKEKGLHYLEVGSQSSDELVRTEASYFLLKIYTSTEKDYLKALSNAQILTRNHPGNLVYCMEQLKLLLILKQNAEVEMFQKKLLNEIHMAENISRIQKNHFIHQIEHLK